MMTKISWPEGKTFAFSIFDDTDLTTLENGPPIYNFLNGLGFKTTKSVWTIQGRGKPKVGGLSCENETYFAWVKELQNQGFEIGLHNVAFHTSEREDSIKGLSTFSELFGHTPQSLANHTGCNESIYWGSNRLTGLAKMSYNVLTRFRNHNKFFGDQENHNLFWGDLCQAQVKYVRNFVYSDINTLKACPYMPYYDAKRPYVNYWFASSEGPSVEPFNQTISEANQEKLEQEGGACIMYTHFGTDFYKNGKLNPRFMDLMTKLSQRNGWFVPVSTLLDYILDKRGHITLSAKQRRELEWRWLRDKMRVGGTS